MITPRNKLRINIYLSFTLNSQILVFVIWISDQKFRSIYSDWMAENSISFEICLTMIYEAYYISNFVIYN